ncbi:YbhB/YbcL family Raf kinase inhibitor-like protein [Mycobacterium sp.]|uniref:YbhB/YbcL family Raf kinase inhibitor-like protein n=1 Tax=Mycobacterium sp. TaxID=1785 RepID=UPI002D5ABC8E|nr:YbhB/YbcL family Raf kinase inhibitor-like protein [Mycobacterium sp.]HZA12136.1 YbhB/YbcL family Raf kinase inhibitor-like protein [Mycobacterium sp.]
MIELIGKVLRPVRAGDHRSRLAALTPELPIDVTSPAFSDGSAIPTKHAGKGVGDNVSPALRWSGTPENTAALVLIIEDDDVPLPRPLMHTIAVLPADVDHIDEGALQPGTPGMRFIKTPLGRGYSGPRPIPGHGAHHYRFHLFAMNKPVPNDVTTRDNLLSAMHNSVTARGVLTGTHERGFSRAGCLRASRSRGLGRRHR